jgi:hypothetical protein
VKNWSCGFSGNFQENTFVQRASLSLFYISACAAVGITLRVSPQTRALFVVISVFRGNYFGRLQMRPLKSTPLGGEERFVLDVDANCFNF